MTFPTRLEPTSNAADWASEAFELFDADTGDDVPATGIVLDMQLVSPVGTVAAAASTTTGKITTAGNSFSWLIPAAEMATVRPGTYRVYVKATDVVEVDQLLATQIEIYEGGFK